MNLIVLIGELKTDLKINLAMVGSAGFHFKGYLSPYSEKSRRLPWYFQSSRFLTDNRSEVSYEIIYVGTLFSL